MAMNLGISSYCLCNKLYSKQWEIFDIMNWAKEHECTHMEVVPFGLPLFKADGVADMDFAKAIGEHAAKLDLPLSAFSLNACFIRPGDDEEQGSSNRERNVTVQYHGTREDKFEQELMRVTTVMNMAKEMGVKNFRSDVCSGAHPLRINTPEQFEEDFPVFVKAVKLLADHAASLGMTLTLENHGLYVNGADRVIRILRAADKPNVGLTVDVGNYLCVDEDPVVSVAKAIKYADMIHLKEIHKTYQGAQPLHVLKGINLDIERGEFVSIMGASGSAVPSSARAIWICGRSSPSSRIPVTRNRSLWNSKAWKTASPVRPMVWRPPATSGSASDQINKQKDCHIRQSFSIQRSFIKGGTR